MCGSSESSEPTEPARVPSQFVRWPYRPEEAGLWAALSVRAAAAMDEITPPPKYRLNLRVVLMSVVIWMGTFLVFAAISVTLAITTNAMYFLVIIMGLVVSTFAMAFYRPEGPWEPLVPYSRLCEPRLETHEPVFVEERSAVYPPSPSVVTRSDPWLCTRAKTTLRSSFSSPRLRGVADDTWPAHSAPARNADRLPDGFLPLVPTGGAPRNASADTLESRNECEQETRVSCHQAYGCYESRVVRTTYEEFHRVSDDVDTIECIVNEELVTTREPGTALEPRSVTIKMEEPVEPAAPGKKKRRLLWNIFSRSDDKAVVKEFSSEKSEDAESNAGLLDEDSLSDPMPFSKARGIAEAPEYTKVVKNIERNILEAHNAYGVLNKSKADNAANATKGGDIGGAQTKPSKEQKQSNIASKGKQGSVEIVSSSPEAQAANALGILNSTESSGSSGAVGGASSAMTSSADPTSTRGNSPVISGGPSQLSSASRLSLVGSTPKDSQPQYLNEGYMRSSSAGWRTPLLQETTSFVHQEGTTSWSLSQRESVSKLVSNADRVRSEEKEVWGSPSWSPVKSNLCGEKASQTSLRDFRPQSSGDDKDVFRMSPLVKAELVEVTVFNNPALPSGSAGGSQPQLARTESKKSQTSKHVQATSETAESGVQMVDEDASPTKKSKRKKIKLLPRFLRAKKKK